MTAPLAELAAAYWRASWALRKRPGRTLTKRRARRHLTDLACLSEPHAEPVAQRAACNLADVPYGFFLLRPPHDEPPLAA